MEAYHPLLRAVQYDYSESTMAALEDPYFAVEVAPSPDDESPKVAEDPSGIANPYDDAYLQEVPSQVPADNFEEDQDLVAYPDPAQ